MHDTPESCWQESKDPHPSTGLRELYLTHDSTGVAVPVQQVQMIMIETVSPPLLSVQLLARSGHRDWTQQDLRIFNSGPRTLPELTCPALCLQQPSINKEVRIDKEQPF